MRYLIMLLRLAIVLVPSYVTERLWNWRPTTAATPRSRTP